MTEREAVIMECIEYMRQRPGRRGVTILEAMLKQEKAKQTKPAADHPWRATVANDVVQGREPALSAKRPSGTEGSTP